LCHQIGAGYRLVQKALKLVDAPDEPAEGSAAEVAWRAAHQLRLEARYHLVACGINHFTFITQLTDRDTGEDLYPRFAQALQTAPADFAPMSRRMFDAFGLFCATGDGHAGEYVGFAADTMALKGYDFDAYEARSVAQFAHINRVADGHVTPQPVFSGERAVPIIDALLNWRDQDELSINVPNQGHIPNLPDGAIVEIPGRVAKGAVAGELQPAFPRGLTGMLRQQTEIQELVVEGAVTGRRKPLLQALLLDPTVRSYMQAEHMLDDLLKAHARYLPLFE
jgi:alpha-galactosidase